MEVKIVNNVGELVQEAKNKNLLLWKSEKPLYEVLEIDEIRKELDSKIKLNLKISYYQIFSKEGFISSEGKGINFPFKDIKQLVEFLIKNTGNYRIVLKSNDKSELFNLIQNLVNLGFTYPVFLQKEIAIQTMLKKLIEKSLIIEKELDKIIKELLLYKVESEIAKKRKDEILQLLNNIKSNLRKLKTESIIKVAVFATKKAGKSMVVNALLGDEYAPTSLELPTPTVVEYYPEERNNIKVEYNSQTGKESKSFNKPSEVKEFLKELFKKVELSGDKLPVIKIFYPKKEGINYIIFDTPGPDLAGSRHGDFIEEYIEKTDLAIFVVDYSKYAQDTEIKLLKQIAENFKKKGKDNSLIIAVNKIDLMYHDEDVEKIKVRVADFIRNKLQILGIKDTVVIPITALYYYYALKLKEVLPELISSPNLLIELQNFDEEEIPLSEEIFSSLVSMLTHLRFIHKLKKPTFQDLINATGFRALKLFIDTIGLEKALLEKRYVLLSLIINDYQELLNRIEASKVLLEKESQKISEILGNFEQLIKKAYFKDFLGIINSLKEKKWDLMEIIGEFFEERLDEIESAIKEEIIYRLKSAQRKVVNTLYNLPSTTDSKEVVKNELQKTKLELKQIKNELLKLKETISFQIGNNIDSFLRENLELILQDLRNIENKLYTETEKFQKQLEKQLEIVKDFLKKEYHLNLQIELPKLVIPDFIDLLKIKIFRNINLQALTFEMEAPNVEVWVNFEKRGFWEKLLSFNWDYYEVKTKSYEAEQYFENLIENWDKSVKKAFEQIRNSNFKIKLIKEIIMEYEKTLDNFSIFIENWIKTILNPIEILIKDLEQEQRKREELINFYEHLKNMIYQNTKTFHKFLEEFNKISR